MSILLLNNKWKETECIPSVPGIAIELSFTALQSEENKSSAPNVTSPLKTIKNSDLESKFQFDIESNSNQNSGKTNKFKSNKVVKITQKVFVVDRNFQYK